MNKTKAVAHQISVAMPEKTHSMDPETLEELNDPKHILAIKKSREEYKKGNFTDFRKFLSELK